MSSIRPSPTPSPGPHSSAHDFGGGSGTPTSQMQQHAGMKGPSARASLQPQPISRKANAQAHLSLRPPGIGGGRPASELLTAGLGPGMPTGEGEAMDQWFENLHNYEGILEEMAAASLDVNFKEELGAIEQWFRVLSEAERTAALYSLLQHSTPMQIRFFVTILQQMARSDPMTAMMSPAGGNSMQSQMEAKLSSMGLKSAGVPVSPVGRSFSASVNRQSFAGPDSNFLSPDTANMPASDAAHTLAQQRAKLKANAHRISAPGTLAPLTDSPRSGGVWSSSQLGQVVERSPSPNSEAFSPTLPPSARPKSTDFAGAANLRSNRMAHVQNESKIGTIDQLSPMVGGNWASMVNTPADGAFANTGTDGNATAGLEGVTAKLGAWNLSNNSNSRITLDDARKFRRSANRNDNENTVYGDDGEPLGGQPGGTGRSTSNPYPSSLQQQMHVAAGAGSAGGWPPNRSPATFTGNRFMSPDLNTDGSLNNAALNYAAAQNMGTPNQLQAQALVQAMANMNLPGGFNMFNNNLSPLASGGLNMPGMEGLTLTPLQQAQIFAAQMAANGYNPAAAAAFNLAAAGLQPPNTAGGRSMGGRSPSGRSPGLRSASVNGRTSAKEKDEEDVDPAMLDDIPAWLRSLRLHKYTPNFEHDNWRDMVVMDEPALEAKGVAALGARRKLLKTFEVVRKKMGIEMPEGAAGTGSSTAAADGADSPAMAEDDLAVRSPDA